MKNHLLQFIGQFFFLISNIWMKFFFSPPLKFWIINTFFIINFFMER